MNISNNTIRLNCLLLALCNLYAVSITPIKADDHDIQISESHNYYSLEDGTKAPSRDRTKVKIRGKRN
jgi:hypothetical protein